MTFLKGIHYSNRLFYNGTTWCMLGRDYYQRFHLAAQYIQSGDVVLDVCAGFGQLRNFLPEAGTYKAIEGNTSCIKHLQDARLDCVHVNLHKGVDLTNCSIDVIVMIISLYQFRNTSVELLLDTFKKHAKQIIIIEDAYSSLLRYCKPMQRLKHYLCACPEYSPASLFTHDEFIALMKTHQYTAIHSSKRYLCGLYNTR